MPSVAGRRRGYKRIGAGLGAIGGGLIGTALPLGVGALAGENVASNLESAYGLSQAADLPPDQVHGAMEQVFDRTSGVTPVSATGGAAGALLASPLAAGTGSGGVAVGHSVGKDLGSAGAAIRSGLLPRTTRARQHMETLDPHEAVSTYDVAQRAGTPENVLRAMREGMQGKRASRLDPKELQDAGIAPPGSPPARQVGRRLGRGLGTLAGAAIPLAGAGMAATLGAATGDAAASALDVSGAASGDLAPGQSAMYRAGGAALGGGLGLAALSPGILRARMLTPVGQGRLLQSLGDSAGRTIAGTAPRRQQIADRALEMAPDEAYAYQEAVRRSPNTTEREREAAKGTYNIRRLTAQERLKGAAAPFDPLEHEETSPVRTPGRFFRRAGTLAGTLAGGLAGYAAGSGAFDADLAGNPITDLAEITQTAPEDLLASGMRPEHAHAIQSSLGLVSAIPGAAVGAGLGRVGGWGLDQARTIPHAPQRAGRLLHAVRPGMDPAKLPDAVRQGFEDTAGARGQFEQDRARARQSLAPAEH